jgi:hypothetical protein
LLCQVAATYREAVNADEREEIAASVAAHAELGPRYDGAVAEGLVERIGEEIDRRVDARLRSLGQQQPAPSSVPRQEYLSPGQQIVPSGYQGNGHPAPGPGPGSAVPGPGTASAAPAVPPRSNGVTGMILGLGSMGLGVGATSVVVSHHVAAAAAVFMVLLIWLAIAVINIAYAQRR